MPQHFTRSTISAEFYCPTCRKPTQHRIDDRRKGPCLDCMARLEQEHADRTPRAPIPTGKQGDLFA